MAAVVLDRRGGLKMAKYPRRPWPRRRMTRDGLVVLVGLLALRAMFFWESRWLRSGEARHAIPDQKVARVTGGGDKGGRGHTRTCPCCLLMWEWPRHGLATWRASGEGMEEGAWHKRRGCARGIECGQRWSCSTLIQNEKKGKRGRG